MLNQPKPSSSDWTILKLLQWTTSYFKSHNLDSPRAAAELLLAHSLQLKRIDLYLQYDRPVSGDELAYFKALIKRRTNREPVAYIIGVKEFWSMDFAVTKDVLIPRPETEHLVEVVLSILPEDSTTGSSSGSRFGPKRILELGVGCGAIILAIASERPNHLFFASDLSIKAVRLAWLNAQRHDLDGKINFFAGDWFRPLNVDIHPFDIIISNPPYIQTKVIPKLQPEVYLYEPVMALNGDEDGLCSIRHIISNAHSYLNKRGSLLLEIGHEQKNDVRKIIDNCGNYEHPVFTKDYSGNDRVVQMRKKNN